MRKFVLRLLVCVRFGELQFTQRLIGTDDSSQSVLSTALPTIVHDLNGTDFIWAATAYTLAGTAATPLVGGLSTVFGRKPILLLALLFFAIGAAVCGSAQNMRMLVLGRGE